MKPLKSPSRLASSLSLKGSERILLVDPPSDLAETMAEEGEQIVRQVEARAIRSAKESYDAIVVWRENRVGSRALFDAIVKRLEPPGQLWVVIAMKKVRGPETPSVHRLERSDLIKAFAPHGLSPDHEVRLSAWHVAHRFVKRETKNGKRKRD